VLRDLAAIPVRALYKAVWSVTVPMSRSAAPTEHGTLGEVESDRFVPSTAGKTSPGLLPPPALPWTERYLGWVPPATRKRALLAWESIPRPRDLREPRSYVHGRRIHSELFAEDFTMLYPLRGRTLYRLARHADRDEIPGALVDCGTYNGGSTALMSAGAPGRAIWAFDSFEGLPGPSLRDTNDPNLDLEQAADFFKDKCVGSEDKLRQAVARFGTVELLEVRKGWFDETLPTARSEIGPIALLHVDGDWYDSVYAVLENLYELVVPGGAIVIDDYAGIPSAGRATDDFKRSVKDRVPMVRIDQCSSYWRKP
jgi:predicted O-methyltransferase YrrM